MSRSLLQELSREIWTNESWVREIGWMLDSIGVQIVGSVVWLGKVVSSLSCSPYLLNMGKLKLWEGIKPNTSSTPWVVSLWRDDIGGKLGFLLSEGNIHSYIKFAYRRMITFIPFLSSRISNKDSFQGFRIKYFPNIFGYKTNTIKHFRRNSIGDTILNKF